MIWLPYAWLALGIIAATVGIIELNSIRKARIAEVINNLAQRWDSKELADARRLVNSKGTIQADEINKAVDENTEELYSLMRVPNFFDSLGVLVTHGCLPTKLVKDFIGEAATDYFDAFKPMLETKRYEGYFKYFTKLIDSIKES